MNKNVKGAIVVAGVLVILYFVNKKYGFVSGKPDNKKVVIAYLDSTFGYSQEHTTFVNSADTEYINAWADAIMAGQDKFYAQGIWHKTAGGRSI